MGKIADDHTIETDANLIFIRGRTEAELLQYNSNKSENIYGGMLMKREPVDGDSNTGAEAMFSINDDTDPEFLFIADKPFGSRTIDEKYFNNQTATLSGDTTPTEGEYVTCMKAGGGAKLVVANMILAINAATTKAIPLGASIYAIAGGLVSDTPATTGDRSIGQAWEATAIDSDATGIKHIQVLIR